jgi:biogenesis of lysosome-related organelles complex 1 subunit 2
MKHKADGISSSLDQLNEKYEELSSYFYRIDKLDEKVSKLEEMAYSIDGYTKRLEAQFKKLGSKSE